MSAGILDPEFDTDTDPLDMTLDVGPNTIKVKGMAETGGAVETYTVTVTWEPPTVTVPGAPTGLTATANGPNQINLDWTAPANSLAEWSCRDKSTFTCRCWHQRGRANIGCHNGIRTGYAPVDG